MINKTAPPLEIWGGVECTFNRVGDIYFNQLDKSGHSFRLSDLDLFASLGIKAIRYPILWEIMAPLTLDQIDWSWADERLNRLRELGIRPIVELMHHGCGPDYALITTPDFATGLAHFAHQVAQRYPWIDAYIPANEPLTTARFSGLYGFWYPHGRDDEMFSRLIINQCQASVLAMEAIRRVNPDAELIQTEDVGRMYSCPSLKSEAEFQNERRWLTFDLMSGRVDRSHKFWSYLVEHGIQPTELEWLVANPTRIDIIGIDYYPTSDRYFDDDIDYYPPECIALSQDDTAYINIEAVRVLDSPIGGFRGRMLEAWERYHLPVAITEAHLSCTREEQLRWLAEAWRAAKDLRNIGVDVRAVTAWALLGSFNWNSLVTKDENYYESGVFDIRGPYPRSTALASLVADLAHEQEFRHPVLHQAGWWQRPERLLYPPKSSPAYLFDSISLETQTDRDKSTRPLLILGASGILGSAFARECDIRGLSYCAVSRREVDITDSLAIETLLEEMRPWAVINASGYVRVDDAESEEESCFKINTEGAARLALACAHKGIKLMCFSSDLVFDGTHRLPYLESHAPAPLNVYGRSKAEMEKRVLDVLPSALVIRTSACFSPYDQRNFVTKTLMALQSGKTVYASDTQVVSPTYVPHLITVAFDLLIDNESGIWHLSNNGVVSWADFALLAARSCDIRGTNHICKTKEATKFIAQRPLFSALGTERGQIMPDLHEALASYRSLVQL
jgi:dTDP-4-dehydrorhamnose reductase